MTGHGKLRGMQQFVLSTGSINFELSFLEERRETVIFQHLALNRCFFNLFLVARANWRCLAICTNLHSSSKRIRSVFAVHDLLRKLLIHLGQRLLNGNAILCCAVDFLADFRLTILIVGKRLRNRFGARIQLSIDEESVHICLDHVGTHQPTQPKLQQFLASHEPVVLIHFGAFGLFKLLRQTIEERAPLGRRPEGGHKIHMHARLLRCKHNEPRIRAHAHLINVCGRLD
mmetsp:Transcript_13012/g.18881  ORF Transcript_13012/g.18881 Transcript_13012/m.18881 type:complete len:230 (+) Transcript_13012:611-1300(+)